MPTNIALCLTLSRSFIGTMPGRNERVGLGLMQCWIVGERVTINSERNDPMQVSPAVLPVPSVPAPPAAPGNRLDRRCGAHLDRGRIV